MKQKLLQSFIGFQKRINTIVRKYGKEIFKYSNTSLVIDIPYSHVHRDVHRETDHVHRESEDVHRENSDVHRESNNPSKTKTIDIEEEQNKDIILKYDENLEYEITDIEIILKLINDNKNITLKEMSLAINKSIKSVQRILREYGKVKYHGKFKKGYWEIID